LGLNRDYPISGGGLEGELFLAADMPQGALPSGAKAFGVFVLSFAGHCSEAGGIDCSLPVMRSTLMAYTVMTSMRGKNPLGRCAPASRILP